MKLPLDREWYLQRAGEDEPIDIAAGSIAGPGARDSANGAESGIQARTAGAGGGTGD